MNKKAQLAIEILWFTTGLLTLSVVGRELFITKGGKHWIFLVMTAVSFMMAYYHHQQRKKK